MQTTAVTADAMELLLRLNETTTKLVIVVKELAGLMEDLKVQAVKPPLMTLKEAAGYIRMSPQYLSQAPTGKGTPPPNCIEVHGHRSNGGKPEIRYEIAELDRWIARAQRRYSEEAQERRWKEYYEGR